jgi:hypothetical protein
MSGIEAASKARKDFHWEIIISVGMMIGTILGVTIPLHLSLQSDIKEMHQEIYQEMKDFHGRLCAIEERNRSK